MEELKKCNQCNTEQSIDKFYKRKKNKTGYNNICNNCCKNSKNKSIKDKPLHIQPIENRLEYLKEIIQEKQGELISTEYKNRDSLLTLQCNKNHIWETKASNIFKGHWCPNCCKNNSHLDELNESRSKKLEDFYNSDTGKINKKLAHEKRSSTMKKQSEELKQNIKNKICSQCNIDKDILQFNKRKTSKDGYSSICKDCTKINRQKYKK